MLFSFEMTSATRVAKMKQMPLKSGVCFNALESFISMNGWNMMRPIRFWMPSHKRCG